MQAWIRTSWDPVSYCARCWKQAHSMSATENALLDVCITDTNTALHIPSASSSNDPARINSTGGTVISGSGVTYPSSTDHKRFSVHSAMIGATQPEITNKHSFSGRHTRRIQTQPHMHATLNVNTGCHINEAAKTNPYGQWSLWSLLKDSYIDRCPQKKLRGGTNWKHWGKVLIFGAENAIKNARFCASLTLLLKVFHVSAHESQLDHTFVKGQTMDAAAQKYSSVKSPV